MRTALTAAPLCLHHEIARPEWVDYNGHMNVAYYVLVFDHATDAVLDYVGLGADYRAASGRSVFVAEAHVTYEREVRAGDPLRIDSRLTAVGGNRFILFHEMYGNGDRERAAANEVLCVHVDMGRRRSAPLPSAAMEQLERLAGDHSRLPRPIGAGRAIALNAGRPAAGDRP